ncbi:MAG: hypothetical protein ACI7YS_12170 [Flavobacterium sp.]
MKKSNFYSIVFVIFFLSNYSMAQNQKDTVFLLKKKTNSSIHNVFIEPYKNSKYYTDLLDFSKFPKNDKLQVQGLAKKWVPIYLYKYNYYMYIPCDLGLSHRIYLSNSHITVEGFELYNYKLNSKIQKFKNSYKFRYIDSDNKNVSVEINIVDTQKGIAIFNFIKNKISSQQLMVDADKLKLFPLIVNDCRYSKTSEFKFDKIDYEKLLKN